MNIPAPPVMIGGYGLRSGPRRGVPVAPAPESNKRQKISEEVFVALPRDSSNQREEEEAERPEHDAASGTRIGHELISSHEQISRDNAGQRLSESTRVNTAGVTRNASHDSDDELDASHLELQVKSRSMMPNDASNASSPRESTSIASDTEDTQALFNLLRRFREIESMDWRKRYEFFTEWTTDHPGRNVAEWLEGFQNIIKPTFYCDQKWEAYIDENRVTGGSMIGETRLRDLRLVMLKCVEDRVLERGKTPEEFLETKSWEDAITGSSRKTETIALRDRMLQDVMARRFLQPRSFDAYMWRGSWQTAIANSENDQERTRIEEQQQRMITEVVAGKPPCSFQMWFKSLEWSDHARRFPEERDILRQLEDKMRSDVFEGLSKAPYGTAWLFRAPEWEQYIEEAQNDQGEKAARSRLWQASRAGVLNGRERRCKTPARARCAEDWDLLRARLQRDFRVNLSQIAKERRIIDAYARFLPEELIMPPAIDDTLTAVEAVNLVRETVRMEKAKFDIATWNQCIQNAHIAEMKKNFMRNFAEMQKTFLTNGLTYRPAEVPADRASVAESIGYGGHRPGIWYYKGELGAGGYGSATLWVQPDSQGRYANREVLKDTYLKTHWDDPAYWSGNIAFRQPLEFEIVRQLNALAESDNIVQYHETKAYAAQRMYRIYMEYAEHGTLRDLVEAHREVKTLRTARGTAVHWRIPHRLLWCIFEGLASALCLAHKGCLPGSSQRPPNVGLVIHRDIKPANILLAAPHADIWPELPVVKVADWGLVALQSDHNRLARQTGTIGWIAPEAYHYGPRDVEMRGSLRCSEASDIWSLGRVMLALANLDKAGVQPCPFGATPPSYAPGVKDKLPPRMVALIDECLESDPNDRIKCDVLWNEIQARVATFEIPFERPMKMRKRGVREILLYQHNKYQPWGI